MPPASPPAAPRPAKAPHRAGAGRLQPGEILDGKYRISRILGEGGMGVVYEGENIRISRRVAIKVLHAHVADDAVSVRRFEREAQAAGRIGSEHIVEVLDLGELPGGERYMVMEYLDGRSLHSLLKHAVDPLQIVPIAIQLLEGLSEAHRAEIIHRDLKPANVFIVKSRRGDLPLVKILDFGISKFRAKGDDFDATSTGMIVGTPYYMAPEQAKAEKSIDHRADLYSVGVILYRAFSGQLPFSAESFTQLVLKVVLEDPVPLLELVPGLDPELAAIAHRGMARNPDERFQSADQFAAALEQWLAHRSGGRGLPGELVAYASAGGLPGGAASAGPARLMDTGPSGVVSASSSQLGAGWRDTPPSGSSLDRAVGATPAPGSSAAAYGVEGAAVGSAGTAAALPATLGQSGASAAVMADPATAQLPSGTWPSAPSAVPASGFDGSLSGPHASAMASVSMVLSEPKRRTRLWLAAALVVAGGGAAVGLAIASGAEPPGAAPQTGASALPGANEATESGTPSEADLAPPPSASVVFGGTGAPIGEPSEPSPSASLSTVATARTATPGKGSKTSPGATKTAAPTSAPVAPQPSGGTANGRPFRQDL